MKLIKDAVQSFTDRQAWGIPVAKAYAGAIKEFRDAALEAGLALGRERDAVKDVTTAINKFRLFEAAGIPIDEAVAAAAVANAEIIKKSQRDLDEQVMSMVQGLPVWGQITGAIILASLALEPFVALVLSAAVAIISFTAGLAAFLAVAAGVGAAFAILGAGILLLGGGPATTADAMQKLTDRLISAKEALVEFDQEHAKVINLKGIEGLTLPQQHQREQLVENIGVAQTNLSDAQGPIATLLAQIQAMRDALAPIAAPFAAMITKFIESYIPGIRTLAIELIGWFGQRLPAALYDIRHLITDLAPDFSKLGDFISKSLGGLSDNKFFSIIEQAIRTVVIPAVEGLITNLIALANWFIKELPVLGPIVKSIFGEIGNWVQGLAGSWGNLNDFVTKTWPQTVKNASDTLKSLKDWWDKNGDSIKIFVGHIVDLIGDFNNIMSLWAKFYDFMNGVGLSPTKLIDALNTIVNALEAITNFVQSLEGNTGGGRRSTSSFNPRGGTGHLVGGGDISTQGSWVGEDGPEFYVPATAGRILPQQSGPRGGSDGFGNKAVKLLSDIEEHLMAIRTQSPGITVGAGTRRNG